MANKSEMLRQRVESIMPSLEIKHLEVSDEGLVNDVVIVNRQLVFRFAKSEKAAADFHREMQILDLIRQHVDVKVPEPVLKDTNCVVYPFIDGDPLLLETIRAMDERDRAYIAETLGRFLFKLHTTDISRTSEELPPTWAPVTRERWLDIYGKVQETVYPLLWNHQVKWAERLFGSMLKDPRAFDYEPVLIHGDLRPYHILVDNEKCELTGVIDFGVAGIGDPASDFGTLINTCGESFVVKMKNTYPGLEDFLPRARFYAQALELQWAWLGLEFKENFWFIAHLGCARDIGT